MPRGKPSQQLSRPLQQIDPEPRYHVPADLSRLKVVRGKNWQANVEPTTPNQLGRQVVCRSVEQRSTMGEQMGLSPSLIRFKRGRTVVIAVVRKQVGAAAARTLVKLLSHGEARVLPRR